MRFLPPNLISAAAAAAAAAATVFINSLRKLASNRFRCASDEPLWTRGDRNRKTETEQKSVASPAPHDDDDVRDKLPIVSVRIELRNSRYVWLLNIGGGGGGG